MSSFKQQNINKIRMVHTLNIDLGICKAETPHYNSHPNRSRTSERCPDHRGEFRDLVFKFVNLFLCLRCESWSKSSLFADLEQANTQEGAGVGPFSEIALKNEIWKLNNARFIYINNSLPQESHYVETNLVWIRMFKWKPAEKAYHLCGCE